MESQNYVSGGGGSVLDLRDQAVDEKSNLGLPWGTGAVPGFSSLVGVHLSHWPACANIQSPDFGPCDCDRGEVEYFGPRPAPVTIIQSAVRLTPPRPWSVPLGYATEDQRMDARRLRLLGVTD
jgi:hypothetical protein